MVKPILCLIRLSILWAWGEIHWKICNENVIITVLLTIIAKKVQKGQQLWAKVQLSKEFKMSQEALSIILALSIFLNVRFW